MRPELAIHAKGIGKRYAIGARQRNNDSLREAIMSASKSTVRGLRQGVRGRRLRSQRNSFWALKDISFEVKRGEVVGVIGGNGAGKSTLLRVLSRITDPTAGLIELRGRVGSLLEVGTGFHPELTGRENIFLNGAVLGMPRTQVRRQFDAIVDFAGVDQFVDTPVKRYSSGMYLRLAFAVAAHLEPEILLVDEVLAVGDAQFQAKCIGKMESVAKEGRTVLFVSHNMSAIRSLCTSGILLNNGRKQMEGDVASVIQQYFQTLGVLETASGDVNEEGNPRSIFKRITVNDSSGNSVAQSEPLTFSTRVALRRPATGFRVLLLISDMHNRQLVGLNRTSDDLGIDSLRAGEHEITVEVPPLWLNPGMYSVNFKIYLDGQTDADKHLSDAFPLDVHGERTPVEAVLNPQAKWRFREAAAAGREYSRENLLPSK